MLSRIISISFVLFWLAGHSFAQTTPQGISFTAEGNNSLEGVQAVQLQGVVTNIDATYRLVEIKGGSGRGYLVEVGSDVKNFDQIKINDIVNVAMLEAVALDVKKTTSGFREKSEKTEVVKAKKGDKPAAEFIRRITVVADVIAIDPSRRQVSLRGPKKIVDLVVNDPSKLANIRVGDQVEVVYATGIAVAVTPAL